MFLGFVSTRYSANERWTGWNEEGNGRALLLKSIKGAIRYWIAPLMLLKMYYKDAMSITKR